MCGIAGFSMSPTSTVNTRELAHNLLTAIQTRGTDASGFAFVKGDQTALYKRAIPGSELALAELPRRADAVVLHTRFATQGDKRDNRNNHPVISPQGYLTLVHNGVISNDYEFRNYGQDDDGFNGLPAVDSSVIPALIERDGVKKGVAQLEGYAAIAWLDSRDKDSRLHVARLDYSPVAFTWLIDGSFVFASTQPLLEGALAMSGLDYGHVFNMPEEQYMEVVGGVIMNSEEGIKMQEDHWARSRFASMTAGGHGSESGYSYSRPGQGTGYNQYGIGSSFGNFEFDDDNPNDDDDEQYEVIAGVTYERIKNSDGTVSLHAVGEWDKDYRNRECTFDPDEAAMAFAPEKNTRDGEDECVGFYIEMEDGSLDYFQTLADLENGLTMLSNLDLFDGAPFPTVGKALRWTNFVQDMGHIGSKSNFNSWLEDFANIDMHESRGVFNLQYVREGLNDILTLAAL